MNAPKPATPLPWRTLKEDSSFPIYHAEDGRVCTLNYAHGIKAQHDCQRQDSTYIVHACNAYPQLVAEVQKLCARNAELVGTLYNISATAQHTAKRFMDHPAKNALSAIHHTAQSALAKEVA